MICPHCGNEAESRELVCYRMHENCWVNMLLRFGIITERQQEKASRHEIAADSKLGKLLGRMNRAIS